jgi:hypothetical protein
LVNALPEKAEVFRTHYSVVAIIVDCATHAGVDVFVANRVIGTRARVRRGDANATGAGLLAVAKEFILAQCSIRRGILETVAQPVAEIWPIAEAGGRIAAGYSLAGRWMYTERVIAAVEGTRVAVIAGAV